MNTEENDPPVRGTAFVSEASVTLPRCIQPGTTVLATRRTTRRHFLMRPDRDGTVQQLYLYTTAVLAKQFGIAMHAVQLLSTHMHEVLTDTRGELPRFMQQRNRLFANALKRHRNWSEEVFARGSPNYVSLEGPAAALREIGYTIANCVAAAAVTRYEDWPGVSAFADGARTTIRVERPQMYFNPKNPRWPQTVELELSAPPSIRAAYQDELHAYDAIRDAVADAVRRARNSVVAAGKSVWDLARLVTVSHEHRATSQEPVRGRDPTIATAGRKDEAEQAFAARRTFLLSYRAALIRLRQGLKDVVFPQGTWRLCQEFGARAASASLICAENHSEDHDAVDTSEGIDDGLTSRPLARAQGSSDTVLTCTRNGPVEPA